MSEHPFNLKGQQKSFGGHGQRDGGIWKSPEFYLRQGIVVAEIVHHGQDDFKLRFVPTEGFSEGETTVAVIGSSFAAGAATGAAVGSIIPGAGTVVGGILGGVAGWLAGDTVGDVIGPTIWTPVGEKGQFNTYDIVQVAESSEGALPPGKYRVEVESKNKWECSFIQPDLGQPQFSLTGEDEEEEKEAGRYIIGPCEPSRRPILANIFHKGPGGLYACAYSIDGMHRCEIHYEEGQFYVEQVQTEIRAGKEYMFLIVADNEWNITFSEGY